MGPMLVATLREGIEAFLIVAIAATYLRRTGRAALLPAVWWGAAAAVAASLVLGIALAAALAAAWVRFGQRVDLALFFQATSIFLALFAVQLLLYAFHEFTEANAVPGIDNAYWHLATEDWAEGKVGELVTAALVLIPLAWVGVTRLRHRARPHASG